MALETLKGVKEIGGFEVKAICEDMGVPQVMYMTNGEPIGIDHQTNTIAFRIQDGPIKENGINGAQVDTLIHAARLILVGLNKKSPSKYNNNAIAHLFSAIASLEQRTLDREKRNVEGTSNA